MLVLQKTRHVLEVYIIFVYLLKMSTGTLTDFSRLFINSFPAVGPKTGPPNRMIHHTNSPETGPPNHMIVRNSLVTGPASFYDRSTKGPAHISCS